jgi:hypothetical protein
MELYKVTITTMIFQGVAAVVFRQRMEGDEVGET